MARKNTTAIYALAGLLFLGGIGWLVYSGFSENSIYFLNVSEAKAATVENLRAARLFGTVAPEGISSPQDGPGVSFLLVDKDDPRQTMPVSFRGIVPDNFKAGAEVIVEGRMNPDKSFSANILMTQCPSKYQKENRKT